MSHNHITRDIKPVGECPACDIYHEKRDAGIKVESDLVKLAIKTLAENQATLAAKFILENPEIKAHEIEIVQQMSRGNIIFSVRKKHI